jgi:hypothetical protein
LGYESHVTLISSLISLRFLAGLLLRLRADISKVTAHERFNTPNSVSFVIFGMIYDRILVWRRERGSCYFSLLLLSGFFVRFFLFSYVYILFDLFLFLITVGIRIQINFYKCIFSSRGSSHPLDCRGIDISRLYH